MSDLHNIENDFINKVTEFIESNISDEQFGVSELAHEIGMSRSNLLRKIKKSTDLSVSQFIRQIRLQHGMEFLKEGYMTVSEVAYKVGFSSPSYFIKCFGDHYGYPPGDVGKVDSNKSIHIQPASPKKNKRKRILGIAGLMLFFLALLFLFYKQLSNEKEEIEKSIAVLPFINDSNDSTNVHIINGLMESILNNLQNIEDLRVISRTSVEKYRDNPEILSKIAKELNVNYFVEGSGQKIGDQILLNIQLIEAPSDKHLWAEQYDRNADDIFLLQREVAKKIATEIKAIITPEENERIDKIPTDNVVAYEYFLKGRDLMNMGTREGLEESIIVLNKAIEQDSEFARAHAAIAIAYYYLDIFQKDKQYSEEINSYSDKALLLDAQLPQSLLAKAMYYMNAGEYDQAIPYLEKALLYNPNSALIINMLSDFYTNYMPDTEKYLYYALKGVQLDIAAHDSVTASFIYLHISNALIQAGFTKEAITYINRSLDYDPENLFSAYVKAYILYARDKNLSNTKNQLIEVLHRDSTRLDVMQEVGKICYYMRDYVDAYKYYKKFLDIRKDQNLNIYEGEDAKIAVVLREMGLTDESELYLRKYKDHFEGDNSIYKHIGLAAYHSYKGEKTTAVNHLKTFSQNETFKYWTILFLEMDPLFDNIKEMPKFQKIMKDINNNFWREHKRTKALLENEGLM